MNQHKVIGSDRPLAYECQCFLMSVAGRATDPKLKSSTAAWAMMLRDSLKLPKERS